MTEREGAQELSGLGSLKIGKIVNMARTDRLINIKEAWGAGGLAPGHPTRDYDLDLAWACRIV